MSTTVTFGDTRPPHPDVGDIWRDLDGNLRTFDGHRWAPVCDPETVGWDPWTDTRSPRGGRRHPRPDPTLPEGSMVLVVDGRLCDADGRDVDRLRRYRGMMEAIAEDWAARRGFVIARGSWSSTPPVDALVDVGIRLECFLTPVTGGVWGEIHAAIAEDAADRAAERAAESPADGRWAPVPTDGPLVVHVEAGPLTGPL